MTKDAEQFASGSFSVVPLSQLGSSASERSSPARRSSSAFIRCDQWGLAWRLQQSLSVIVLRTTRLVTLADVGTKIGDGLVRLGRRLGAARQTGWGVQAEGHVESAEQVIERLHAEVLELEAKPDHERTVTADAYTEIHLKDSAQVVLTLPGREPVSVSSNTAVQSRKPRGHPPPTEHPGFVCASPRQLACR